MCGITVGEYIRSRQLTLAGNDLAQTNIKVIDAALKYGYGSPESFTRAFTRFHGIAPSDVKRSGGKLRSFSPFKLQIILKGGNSMKPRVKKIIKMIPFLEIGLCLILLIVSFLIKDRPYKITFTYADKKIISHSWHDIFSSVIVTVCLIFLLLTVACIIACIIEKIRTKEKNNKYISIHCFTFFLCYFIIMFCDILVIGLWTEEDYSPFCYEFSDSNHTIVIEEESFLLYGGANVYQINDNNEAIIIHKFHTDDGGRNHGQYDIKWYENYAEITYNTCDLENTKHTDRITFVD